MSEPVDFATAAALIGDPARAAILNALLDGRARPAGELAYASGVTPQTASSHLSKLVDGGLLDVEAEGRHRYYRLAGAHVAQALEQLVLIRPRGETRRKPLTRQAKALQGARRCYDHLAGRLGVGVTERLQVLGYISPAPAKRFEVTDAGSIWLASIGIDLGRLRPSRTGLARQCLDWTERTHHLAGPLGVALLDAFCNRGWLRRSDETRAVQVTPKGQIELKRQLGVELADEGL